MNKCLPLGSKGYWNIAIWTHESFAALMPVWQVLALLQFTNVQKYVNKS